MIYYILTGYFAVNLAIFTYAMQKTRLEGFFTAYLVGLAIMLCGGVMLCVGGPVVLLVRFINTSSFWQVVQDLFGYKRLNRYIEKETDVDKIKQGLKMYPPQNWVQAKTRKNMQRRVAQLEKTDL